MMVAPCIKFYCSTEPQHLLIAHAEAPAAGGASSEATAYVAEAPAYQAQVGAADLSSAARGAALQRYNAFEEVC